MTNPLFCKLNDPIATAPSVNLTVDGEAITAEPGDTIAAALLRLDPPLSRTTPVRGSPRAPYCMMGVCFECLAVVDGVTSQQTCLVEVKEGMKVERQHGRLLLRMAELETNETRIQPLDGDQAEVTA
jgi:predicted molibdopterin-dependent oxidoreductase YjgC